MIIPDELAVSVLFWSIGRVVLMPFVGGETVVLTFPLTVVVELLNSEILEIDACVLLGAVGVI